MISDRSKETAPEYCRRPVCYDDMRAVPFTGEVEKRRKHVITELETTFPARHDKHIVNRLLTPCPVNRHLNRT